MKSALVFSRKITLVDQLVVATNTWLIIRRLSLSIGSSTIFVNQTFINPFITG